VSRVTVFVVSGDEIEIVLLVDDVELSVLVSFEKIFWIFRS